MEVARDLQESRSYERQGTDSKKVARENTRTENCTHVRKSWAGRKLASFACAQFRPRLCLELGLSFYSRCHTAAPVRKQG